MELTIFNTYVVMESQEQCDRMKQLCIDNNLPIWDYNCAFEFDNEFDNDVFSFEIESKEFFTYPFEHNEEDFKNKTQVTEQEFINILNKHNEKRKTK